MSQKAGKLVAKVLQQCQKILGSTEAVKTLWTQSRLEWHSLGIEEDQLGEFLDRQVCLHCIVVLGL